MNKPHVIIVGAGPGIGLEAARAFGVAGFAVSLLARSPGNLRRSIQSLHALGVTAEPIVADAGDAASLSRGIAAAVEVFGIPDALIYNAVAFSEGLPTAIDPATLISSFSVNAAGALVATQAVLPGMRQRGMGTLLFTGGAWAIHPDPAFASMGIGKGALRTLVTLLAQELKDSVVRVGTLTVMGTVARGSAFDPAAIGDAFLDFYRKPTETFPVEVQFLGKP